MEKKQLSVEIRPEIASGTYSNLVIVTQSKTEFILDFAMFVPGPTPKAQVGSRVILTPEHCKRLLALLRDNVAKYESQFGTIEIEPRGMTINLADITHNGTKS